MDMIYAGSRHSRSLENERNGFLMGTGGTRRLSSLSGIVCVRLSTSSPSHCVGCLSSSHHHGPDQGILVEAVFLASDGQLALWPHRIVRQEGATCRVGFGLNKGQELPSE